MVYISKQFGDWVIDLRSDLFIWARLKLTALYLLIIVIVLAVYSSILYTSVTQHIRDNFEGTVKEGVDLDSLFTSTTDNLQNAIIVIDAVVIIAAAGASYALAGYTLKPIRRTLESQAAFTADASHELRTPLAVMRSDIEVLLRSKQTLPQEARKVLESNLEEVKSLSTMSEQLLDLARGNHPTVKENFKLIQFSDLVVLVVNKLTTLAAHKHIEIHREIQDGLRIAGNQNSLERMVQNIVVNSIIYNKDAGSITVKLAADNKIVRLVISDTGKGVTSKDLPHIFDRFYKADTSRSSQIGGSGLGLAIVKQIVAQHKGTIEITSELDKGTVVMVKLPRI